MPASWSASTGGFEAALASAAPILARIGFHRLERPAAALEAGVKGLLFDCRMCGDCVLWKNGHVLPDELPESAAQRPVRRRPLERQLRGLSRYALRLG